MDFVVILDNIILWILFGTMVWLRYFKDWFQPRQQHTDHLLEILLALPFNYLSEHWTLEVLIVLMFWWTINEWRYQTKGRSFRQEINLFWEKCWG